MFHRQRRRASLDIEALDRALGAELETQGRALLFLNDPCHNPTGYSMRPTEWRAVVERLVARAERGAPIALLVDMAYFAYNAHDPRAFLRELLPLLGKVTLLFAWSASKTFTHYGLRVGALVACIPDPKAARGDRSGVQLLRRAAPGPTATAAGSRRDRRVPLTDREARRARDATRSAATGSRRRCVRASPDAFNAMAPGRGLRVPALGHEGASSVTVFHEDGACGRRLPR